MTTTMPALSTVEQKLVQQACRATEQAYAPYSNFQVGAAVQAENGKIYSGCNVENASYGLTICAERNAIARTIADGQRRITAIAIAAVADTPPSPCGACRQVLMEFASPQTTVLLCCVHLPGDVRRYALSELLPHPFTAT